jgi:hypothetical protein
MWQRQSPPQPGGEVRSHRTCGSVGAHLSREVRSRVIGHVAVSEPTLVGRRGLEPYDTWQRRSPPQSGDEVRSHRTRGSAGAHLSLEAMSGATGMWQHRSPPQPRGEIRSHRTRGSAEAHLSREARSGTIGHVTARGCMPCYLS